MAEESWIPAFAGMTVVMEFCSSGLTIATEAFTDVPRTHLSF
jgi:hypothetical protein